MHSNGIVMMQTQTEDVKANQQLLELTPRSNCVDSCSGQWTAPMRENEMIISHKKLRRGNISV